MTSIYLWHKLIINAKQYIKHILILKIVVSLGDWTYAVLGEKQSAKNWQVFGEAKRISPTETNQAVRLD